MGNKITKLRARILCAYLRIQNFYNSNQRFVDFVECINISCSNLCHRTGQSLTCSCKKQEALIKEFRNSKTLWPEPIVNYLFLPEFQKQKPASKCDLQIISFIANGAFGKVFKVFDRNSQKYYALKILQKSRIIEEDAVLQVKDELHIQSVCGHHQFIVKCLFSWQTYSELFLVSDYKSGGELLSLIETCAPLPENIVKIYVAEIALAIDFLHNAGIIHRDVKPENILLDENYHVNLTDFGLSKWLSTGSRTSTICGTLQYMAPEIEEGCYSHAVDWWSLGIITCRLLTNEYPKIANSNTILPQNVTLSNPSKDLLLRLLFVDPRRRLRTLYTLKTIAFFKDFNFTNISDKKINPKELLISYYGNLEKKFTKNVEDFDMNG